MTKSVPKHWERLLTDLEADLDAMTPGPWHRDHSVEHDVVLWGPAPNEFIGNVGDWSWQHGSDGQYRVIVDLDKANAQGIARLRAIANGVAMLLRTLVAHCRILPPTLHSATMAVFDSIALTRNDAWEWVEERDLRWGHPTKRQREDGSERSCLCWQRTFFSRPSEPLEPVPVGGASVIVWEDGPVSVHAAGILSREQRQELADVLHDVPRAAEHLQERLVALEGRAEEKGEVST